MPPSLLGRPFSTSIRVRNDDLESLQAKQVASSLRRPDSGVHLDSDMGWRPRDQHRIGPSGSRLAAFLWDAHAPYGGGDPL